MVWNLAGGLYDVACWFVRAFVFAGRTASFHSLSPCAPLLNTLSPTCSMPSMGSRLPSNPSEAGFVDESRVSICVVSGHGLPRTRWLSKCDPFVIMIEEVRGKLGLGALSW